MKKKWQRFVRNKELMLLAVPGLIWFLVFAYLPMIGIVIAFKQYRITSDNFFVNLWNSAWVGLDNFKFLFSSSDAWIITRNTLFYNFVFIILGLVIPIMIAIALNELLNKKFAKFYQSAMFMPYFLSWVVVSYCLFAFLSPESGLVNSILSGLGMDPISWYNEPGYWPYILIFMSQWKGVGYNTVIFLAALVSLDKSLYEASMLDGATKWQQIRYITLPLLKPVVIILFILAVGRIFYSDFGLFFQLPRDSGALYSVTNVIDTYVFRSLMSLGEIGMSSAAALYQSIVGFILVMITNFIVKRIDKDRALI